MTNKVKIVNVIETEVQEKEEKPRFPSVKEEIVYVLLNR